MTSDELCWRPATELAGLIRRRKVSPVEVTDAVLDRIDRVNPRLNAFVLITVLVTPTTPCPAFPVGLEHPAEIAGTPITRYTWVPYTYPFNVTGQPACSVPAGFTKARLPVGLQIVGRRFDDATVLRAAAAFERARPWAAARPPLD